MENIYVYIGNIDADIEENVEKQEYNFKLKYDKSNIIYFDLSDDIDIDILKMELKDSYNNLSLFSTKKLIILKNISKLLKSENGENGIVNILINYLKNSDNNITTIIQDKKIDKRSKFFKQLQELEKNKQLKIYDVSFSKTFSISSWMLKVIQNNNFKITQKAFNKILELFDIKKDYKGEYIGDFDTIKIKNQLLKLFDYKKNNKLIKEEDINVIGLNYENPDDDDIFELVNLIFQKNKKSLQLFEKIFYNSINEKLKLDELIFFNTIMINQIEDMIIVSDMIDNRLSDLEIVNKLNWQNPKKMYPLKLKLRQFRKEDLSKFYKQFEEIDILSKTDQEISLYKLNLLIINMIN